jgi:hypothetical protein
MTLVSSHRDLSMCTLACRPYIQTPKTRVARGHVDRATTAGSGPLVRRKESGLATNKPSHSRVGQDGQHTASTTVGLALVGTLAKASVVAGHAHPSLGTPQVPSLAKSGVLCSHMGRQSGTVTVLSLSSLACACSGTKEHLMSNDHHKPGRWWPMKRGQTLCTLDFERPCTP